ncbi:hypothetical protein D3C78_1617350 [compost metagenome]
MMRVSTGECSTANSIAPLVILVLLAMRLSKPFCGSSTAITSFNRIPVADAVSMALRST